MPQPKKPDPLQAALDYEAQIATEAAEIRGEEKELTPALFMALWPLLRKPIHEAFIVTTPATKGKPYPSTGVKSVQVQMNRMDGVLTPLWWDYVDRYETSDEGYCLCHVEVTVGSTGQVLLARSSWGGVNQASTLGNLRKGAFTNAAKVALARVGPAFQVYIGATDLDPDTDKDAAKAQEPKTAKGQAKPRKLPADAAQRLAKAVEDADLTKHLPAKLASFGVSKLEDLTVDQSVRIYEWTQGNAEGD